MKVEPPGEGDSSRRSGPFPGYVPHPEKSGLFLYLNTGKNCITLNWKEPAGMKVLERLVQVSDVLVEDLGPRVLDSASLQRLNPSLIVTSISGFGHDGPYSHYRSADIVMQALGGGMKLTGLPDREPLKIAGPQADYQAGLNAAVATMAALYFRDETGRGQHVEVSAIEALASILEGTLLSYAYDGALRNRDGARRPSVYPSTILPCKDGWVHVDAGADWETFARFTGIEALLKYNAREVRGHADEIDRLLVPWLAGFTREELFLRAQEWRLPSAMVLGIDELPGDPQLRDRQFFVNIEHPAAGPLTYPGAPFQMSASEPVLERAPLLGEHNGIIYRGLLGCEEDEIKEWKERGII